MFVRPLFAARSLLLIPALAAAPVAKAQLPGLPVLQNAFANPGITVGLNYGRGTDLTGYALAGAWAPGSARFVLSAGIGSATPDDGEASAAYGGRVSAPVFRFMGDAAGLGVFGGYGRAKEADMSIGVLGASAGYRRTLGGLGVSVHVAPSYQRFAASAGDESVSTSLFRYSAGVDVSYGARFGATIGFEAGAKPDEGEPGPGGSVFGLGISYALRRVQ